MANILTFKEYREQNVIMLQDHYQSDRFIAFSVREYCFTKYIEYLRIYGVGNLNELYEDSMNNMWRFEDMKEDEFNEMINDKVKQITEDLLKQAVSQMRYFTK